MQVVISFLALNKGYRKSLVEDAGLFDFNMLPSSLFDENFYLNSRNVDVFSL